MTEIQESAVQVGNGNVDWEKLARHYAKMNDLLGEALDVATAVLKNSQTREIQRTVKGYKQTMRTIDMFLALHPGKKQVILAAYEKLLENMQEMEAFLRTYPEQKERITSIQDFITVLTTPSK